MKKTKEIDEVLSSLERLFKRLPLDIPHESLWAILANCGFWDVPVPPQYKGLGLGWPAWMAALEKLMIAFPGDITFYNKVLEHAYRLFLVLRYPRNNLKKSQALFLLQNGIQNNIEHRFFKSPHAEKEASFFKAFLHSLMFINTMGAVLQYYAKYIVLEKDTRLGSVTTDLLESARRMKKVLLSRLSLLGGV